MVEDTAFQAVNIINLSSDLFKIETGSFQLNHQSVMIKEILQRIQRLLFTINASQSILSGVSVI
jgi:hypothetical protein